MTEKKICEWLGNDGKKDCCFKGAPCDENYDDLMGCPAVQKIEVEELPKPYKPKFVDLNKKIKINPGWMR